MATLKDLLSDNCNIWGVFQVLARNWIGISRRQMSLVRQPWAFFAKHSAEKTKYIDVSQPALQGDELKRR